MKTREPPHSSKGRGKAGANAEKGPMGRFRESAKRVMSVPKAAIDKAERNARKGKP